ncbi:MAG: FAD-dependent monooxygenase [Candidatus Paracaedibacteraceae bacterium]|nr:FAD-dependent monooxygenase [Candidatus Paracaedibacteraceae bacterium]
MHQAQVCILGGGLVGGVMALSLAHRGISSIVVDTETPDRLLAQNVDGRTTAVNLASSQFFEEIDLWQPLSGQAARIDNIKVYEANQPWSIQFDHQELGRDPMGYIVENRFIRQGIFAKALNHPLIKWCAPDKLLTKKIKASGVEIYLESGEMAEVSLIIGAEGRHSPTRDDRGIKKKQFTYSQKGLVFSLYHDKPHHNIAWEVFHASGPLAFLPMLDSVDGRHRSGVVWTLPETEADTWAQKDVSEVATRLVDMFPHLGEFELFTQIWCYPLIAQMVDRFIDDRYVIIGDAAHVCHPVAGQGVNVGWRDAKALTDILVNHLSLGLDLGSQTTLQTYQRSRRMDTYAMFAMTDLMVRLFSNDSKILSPLRSMGLGAVNKVSPLKKFFMKRAMGV